jgi:hypothetical protein
MTTRRLGTCCARNHRQGGVHFVAIVLLLLVALTVSATASADPKETLSVIVADGTLSLEAANSSLDRVLIKVGEMIHARVVIETSLADDLARAGVNTSFTRVPVIAALRRLLLGRQYVLVSGPAGLDEVRVYVDGTTGYRELTPPDPVTKSQPGLVPLAAWPPDNPAEIARLRQILFDGRDASARVQALDDLSNIRDTALLVETLSQVLARERDSAVLKRLLELTAQQDERIPPEALRGFVTSNRDGTPRALAVELLADQTGDDPATRAVLRSLATNDLSSEVREAAQTALANLEAPPPPASEFPNVKRTMGPAAPKTP